MNNMGLIIKSLLEYKNITQSEFSKITTIPLATMRGYLNGTFNPTKKNIDKINNAFNMDINQLLQINLNNKFVLEKIFNSLLDGSSLVDDVEKRNNTAGLVDFLLEKLNIEELDFLTQNSTKNKYKDNFFKNFLNDLLMARDFSFKENDKTTTIIEKKGMPSKEVKNEIFKTAFSKTLEEFFPKIEKLAQEVEDTILNNIKELESGTTTAQLLKILNNLELTNKENSNILSYIKLLKNLIKEIDEQENLIKDDK